MQVNLQLQPFVDGIQNYFQIVTGESLVVEPSYTRGNQPCQLGYARAITIRGDYEGTVCFTAQKELLEDVAQFYGFEPSPESYNDFVGEVANIASGSVQEHFPGRIVLSVPEEPDVAVLMEEVPTYVIPMHWRENQASLSVYLQAV